MEISIRQEKPEDIAAVFKLNVAAFPQDGEAKLVDALRRNSEVFIPELSLVAVSGNTVVGHILFTMITIIAADGEDCSYRQDFKKQKHQDSLRLLYWDTNTTIRNLVLSLQKNGK